MGVLAGILALLLPAVGAADRPKVMGTFYPLFEWARQVGGNRIEAANLLRPGVEPHDFEPSPADVRRMREMDLVIVLGEGFQPSLDKALRGVKDKRPVRLTVTQDMALRRGPATPGKKASRPDMHVWLDPVLAQQVVRKIAAALARIDPAGSATYEANAEQYIARLAALDQEFRAGLATCRRKEVITSHSAFAYMLERYGLTQFAVMGLSPDAEPSPRQLARLAKFAKERGVRAVYYETLVSPRVAATLAKEIGAKTLVLNPIEGLTADEEAQGKDYLALMRDNLASLRAGQDCGP